MTPWVRGGKVEGGHREGEQIFFDLLELKASWVRLKGRGGKKEKGEGERAVTLSH